MSGEPLTQYAELEKRKLEGDMKQTAESLTEPSSSTTCSITLIKDRLMTNSIICKHV